MEDYSPFDGDFVASGYLSPLILLTSSSQISLAVFTPMSSFIRAKQSSWACLYSSVLLLSSFGMINLSCDSYTAQLLDCSYLMDQPSMSTRILSLLLSSMDEVRYLLGLWFCLGLKDGLGIFLGITYVVPRRANSTSSILNYFEANSSNYYPNFSSATLLLISLFLWIRACLFSSNMSTLNDSSNYCFYSVKALSNS